MDSGKRNDYQRTAVNTTVRFNASGTYLIVLEATNGKETKLVEKKITVKENSNLYILPDVRLGITTAHETIGCFYSTILRKVLKQDEVTIANGPQIDIVFFGLGEKFLNCCFISPDSVAEKAFPDIPGACHTWIVNLPENFSAGQFDAMKNDLPFGNLDIKQNSDQNLTTYFTKESVPHVVLFETYDGRKGAIKIKKIVADGESSYIIMDIKLQKEKK